MGRMLRLPDRLARAEHKSKGENTAGVHQIPARQLEGNRGRLEVTGGGWRITDGGWRVTDGGWR